MATIIVPVLVRSTSGVNYYWQSVNHNTQNQGETVTFTIPAEGRSQQCRFKHCVFGTFGAATAPDADANNWRVRVSATKQGAPGGFFTDLSDRLAASFADGGTAPDGWYARFDVSNWPIFDSGDVLTFWSPITDTNAAPTADFLLSCSTYAV